MDPQKVLCRSVTVKTTCETGIPPEQLISQNQALEPFKRRRTGNAIPTNSFRSMTFSESKIGA